MAADPSTLEALASAVGANDAEAVAHALAAQPDLASHLNDPMPNDAFGATPLLGAIHHGNREMVDLLLRPAPTSTRAATGGPAASAYSTIKAR